MSNRPSWKKSHVPWEKEVVIWERMALGENDIQVGFWLDTRGFHLDRETLGRVRRELADLPEPLAKRVPDTIRLFRRQLRGESPLAVTDMSLMAQLALAEKVKTHWAGLLEPLQSLKGLGVFTPGAREIQTWLLELDARDWMVPGGQVHRDENDQLSVTLDVERQDGQEQLRQHLPSEPIWAVISDYSRATLADLTARRDLLNRILDHVGEQLAVPIILENQRDRPATPYVHVNFVGALYELVLRRVSGLPFNPVLESDFWEGEGGGMSLSGLPLFFYFSKDLAEKATSLLILGPDPLAESSVARAAGDYYLEAEQKSKKLSAVISQMMNRTEPPAGSSCDRCWDWLEALGALS